MQMAISWLVEGSEVRATAENHPPMVVSLTVSCPGKTYTAARLEQTSQVLDFVPSETADCTVTAQRERIPQRDIRVAIAERVSPFAMWTCPASYYGQNNRCDCACGAPDPDCATPLSGSCAHIEAPCAAADNEQNWLCEDPLPMSWKCDRKHYDAGDGCDCGCGAWDPDCDANGNGTQDDGEDLASVCDRCGSAGGLSTKSDCSDILPDDNSAAGPFDVPTAWSCADGYYGNNHGCDCGCGAVDSACATNSSVDQCTACNSGGSCLETAANSCDPNATATLNDDYNPLCEVEMGRIVVGPKENYIYTAGSLGAFTVEQTSDGDLATPTLWTRRANGAYSIERTQIPTACLAAVQVGSSQRLGWESCNPSAPRQLFLPKFFPNTGRTALQSLSTGRCADARVGEKHIRLSSCSSAPSSQWMSLVR